MYLIKRISDGFYVSKPRSAHAYTKWLREARRFQTKEEAESQLCVESERVVSLYDEL